MREVLYKELRNCVEKMGTEEDCQESLFATVDKVLSMGKIAREVGLLAVDEAAKQLDDEGEDKYLKAMLLRIVDGLDPELVQDIFTARYFSNQLGGCQGLQYLICLEGILAIQRGESLYTQEEILLSFLPWDLAEKYREKAHAGEDWLATEGTSTESLIEELCKEESSVEPRENCYFLSQLMDYILISMNDHSIQRLLRDVDNHDLCMLMIGISGKARRRVFDNLSDRLAAMIAKDICDMGQVRISDVEDAIGIVANVLIRLIQFGEIVSGGSKELEFLFKIFVIPESKDDKQEVRAFEAELQRMVEEYQRARREEKPM